MWTENMSLKLGGQTDYCSGNVHSCSAFKSRARWNRALPLSSSLMHAL